MCEERLTLARQTPSRAIWELHAFTPGFSPFRLHAQPFCLCGEQGREGRRGSEPLNVQQASGRLYKLRRARAWFVQGQAFLRAGRGLRPSPAAPWRRRSARRSGRASARTAAACSPRPPRAPRGTGARTPGTALRFLYRIPPAPASPAPPLRSRPPLLPTPSTPLPRGPRSAAIGSAESGLTSPLRAFAPHSADPEASGDRGLTHEESRRRRPRTTPRRW